jgi:hypothetical protein
VSDEPAGGRLEGRGRQAVAEVGLVEPDQSQARRRRVVAEPTERRLISGGEQDESVGFDVPVDGRAGVFDRELERGVRGLTCLGPGGKIGAGDQIETRVATLAVRHESTVADRRKHPSTVDDQVTADG